MLARLGFAAAVVAVAALGGSAAPAGVRAAPLPHVTVFGDSIAEAIVENDSARAILVDGVDVDFEVAPCRRLVQDSCPYNGGRPPTVMQVVKTLGSRIGPTVIVALGYNEFEDQFAGNVQVTLDAFENAGVKQVLWLTLRAARHPYVNMNDALVAAAATHPSLVVVDWNLYSRSHAPSCRRRHGRAGDPAGPRPGLRPQELVSVTSSGVIALSATVSSIIAWIGAVRRSVGEPGLRIQTSSKRSTCGTCVCP